MEKNRKVTTEVKISPKLTEKIGQLLILSVAAVVLGSVFLASIIINSLKLAKL